MCEAMHLSRPIYLSVYLSIYLSIYLTMYSPFFGLGRFFSFLIYTQSAGLLGRGSARRKAATYTQNNTNRIRAHRHPCLEWDSNPQSQCSRERREFMP
jgi:hypothetical protein